MKFEAKNALNSLNRRGLFLVKQIHLFCGKIGYGIISRIKYLISDSLDEVKKLDKGKLSFIYDHKKTVQAVNYFLKTCPDVTRMKANKLLYFADRIHLNRHGRTVTGANYVAMEYGPVPSEFYESITSNLQIIENVKYRTEFIKTIGKHDLASIKDVDFDEFSKSDLDVLKEVATNYGQNSAYSLKNLSHIDDAYTEPWNGRGAKKNPPMDLEKFFDPQNIGSPEYKKAHDISEATDCLK